MSAPPIREVHGSARGAAWQPGFGELLRDHLMKGFAYTDRQHARLSAAVRFENGQLLLEDSTIRLDEIVQCIGPHLGEKRADMKLLRTTGLLGARLGLKQLHEDADMPELKALLTVGPRGGARPSKHLVPSVARLVRARLGIHIDVGILGVGVGEGSQEDESAPALPRGSWPIELAARGGRVAQPGAGVQGGCRPELRLQTFKRPHRGASACEPLGTLAIREKLVIKEVLKEVDGHAIDRTAVDDNGESRRSGGDAEHAYDASQSSPLADSRICQEDARHHMVKIGVEEGPARVSQRRDLLQIFIVAVVLGILVAVTVVRTM